MADVKSYDRLFIDGAWVEPATDDRIEVLSPATGALIATAPEASVADAERALVAARAAFESGDWADATAADRAAVLRRAHDLFLERSDALAELITAEVGCPILFSHFGQVGAAGMVLDYYAGLAGSFPFEEVRDGMLGPALVRREGVGVCVGIVPWNVPVFISLLKVAPALASGSTMVLKPAPETPLSAMFLAELFDDAGLPPGVLSVLPADREVGEFLVSHPHVDKVSFTGSTAAGERIGGICGAALRRCTLELGGKSAAILRDDVDVASVVPELLPYTIMNNGQACVAQTRILAPRGRYDEVVDAFTGAMAGLTVGDPAEMTTDVGPLISERQRERVEGYIAIGRDEGAKVVFGGGRPDGPGYFVEPTLFAGVDNSMRIAQEEIFGPAVCVIPYEDDADAVAIANDSDYGLSGSVWTADEAAGLDMARQVRTGTYNVNTYGMEWSAPFGGFKKSGVGRELGPEGLAAYLEDKTINLPAGSEPELRY